MHQDSYRHRGLRRQLIANLRERGIVDEAVLAAMESVPRHFFLEKAFEDWAYQDKAFPIGCEQTISQPYTVAFMSSALQVAKRQKVLEIGTGSGYQAAVLASLGARVFTVERWRELADAAQQRLTSMGFQQIRCFHRDGYKGLPEYAPFERIMVTAGAPKIPEALKKQLSIGGILLIPVGENQQRMVRVWRIDEHTFQEEELGDFKFVPFIEGLNP